MKKVFIALLRAIGGAAIVVATNFRNVLQEKRITELEEEIKPDLARSLQCKVLFCVMTPLGIGRYIAVYGELSEWRVTRPDSDTMPEIAR